MPNPHKLERDVPVGKSVPERASLGFSDDDNLCFPGLQITPGSALARRDRVLSPLFGPSSPPRKGRGQEGWLDDDPPPLKKGQTREVSRIFDF